MLFSENDQYEACPGYYLAVAVFSYELSEFYKISMISDNFTYPLTIDDSLLISFCGVFFPSSI